jgi:TetR/AcrR family transcriptional repressor of uid operon
MARQADPDLAQRRRRQILDAALACFRRRGFHQTSMHEICTEAGLSAGALYRYFPSKSEIIAAIAEEDWRTREPIFEAIARGPDVVGALCALADHAVDKCAGQPSLVADVIAEAMRDPGLSQRFAAREAETRQRLAKALSAAHRRGLIALGQPAERAAGIVILMLDGLVLRAAGLGECYARAHVQDFRAAIERLFTPARSRRAQPRTTEETDR